MTELEELHKSFDYWIGNPQSKGSDVSPKDRPYFLDVLKCEYKELIKINSDLRSKNRTLNVDKEMLKGENGSLKEINSELTEENQQLEKENNELQKKYAELNDFSNSQCAKLLKENAELKVQIEKMKCCWNCSHHDDSSDSCGVGCQNKDKWELAE